MTKRNVFISFLAGILFAIGLGVAGMTKQENIINFFDIAGNWDPSLIFVMIGAIAVHSTAYFAINKAKSPMFSSKFMIPTSTELTKDLVIGAALFGTGWAITGLCPGPGLVNITTGSVSSIIFILAMLGGMYLFRFTKKYL